MKKLLLLLLLSLNFAGSADTVTYSLPALGNYIYGDDGSSCYTQNNYLYCNNGANYPLSGSGNYIYGSDGSSCYFQGNYLYCDDGVAIKIVKAPIVKGSILVSKLKSWTKMLRGKKPIYTTKGGTQIKVESLDDEKSIILNKFF